jgi:hypothetical protein
MPNQIQSSNAKGPLTFILSPEGRKKGEGFDILNSWDI